MPDKEDQGKTLKVKRGVTAPGTINPEAVGKLKQHRKAPLSARAYLEGILASDRSLLSQAITLVESSLPEHQALAREILQLCLPYTGRSIRIGITGVPGVGKSSFIEAMGRHITREGSRLAVLAIDPSSERSGGSIMGDKTRMETLSADPQAYIRPSPAGGSLGGVARKTRETILLCEAGGYNVIFIETVGVGQSETAVHSMVDFFLLLMLAGAGDELQGIKRGIMEMADAIAITKADGQNRDMAEHAMAEYQQALHLFPPKESGIIPAVLTCSALDERGLKEIWENIRKNIAEVHRSGYFEKKRRVQARFWMYEFIEESLRNRFYGDPDIRSLLEALEQEVLNGKKTSFDAALEVLKKYQSATKP